MTAITIELSDEVYKKLKAASERENVAIEEIARCAIEREVTGEQPTARPLTREEETRLIREAMKGRIWAEGDADQLFGWLDDHPMSEEEIDEILANLPVGDPTFSETIIRMRGEERS